MSRVQTFPRHPARYSRELLPVLAEELRGVPGPVLDPFAGTGERLEELAQALGLVPGVDIIGNEIQPRWAAVTPELVRVGNALALPDPDGFFGAVVTSPTYGNRLADCHNARDGSVRHSYTHDHGEPLHPDNSGTLQWGPRYRDFHVRAWCEVARVLRPGGRFVLNIKDHYRLNELQPVTDWHLAELERLGFVLINRHRVNTRSLRYGSNAALRTADEHVLALTKGGGR